MTTNPQTVEMLQSLSIDRNTSARPGSEQGDAGASGGAKAGWSKRTLLPQILAAAVGACTLAAVIGSPRTNGRPSRLPRSCRR